MRQRLHQLVGLAFWALLLLLWARLAAEGRAGLGSLRSAGQSVAVMAGVVLAVTIWWIRHNVAIHREKGPRREQPVRPPRTDQDRLGRPIDWSAVGGPEGAQRAARLVIDLRDGRKRYELP